MSLCVCGGGGGCVCVQRYVGGFVCTSTECCTIQCCVCLPTAAYAAAVLFCLSDENKPGHATVRNCVIQLS